MFLHSILILNFLNISNINLQYTLYIICSLNADNAGCLTTNNSSEHIPSTGAHDRRELQFNSIDHETLCLIILPAHCNALGDDRHF